MDCGYSFHFQIIGIDGHIDMPTGGQEIVDDFTLRPNYTCLYLMMAWRSGVRSGGLLMWVLALCSRRKSMHCRWW